MDERQLKAMVDSLYDEEKSFVEEELTKDKAWITASKNVYKHLEGMEWDGSDEDIAKEGLSMMSKFNFNITTGTLGMTNDMLDADDDTKLSFYYMLDTYDKKDISLRGIGRAMKELALDPASYVGLSTLGAGFVGKQAAAVGAKQSVKKIMKAGARRFLQNPVAVGAVETAAYAMTDDLARQNAKIEAKMQEGVNIGENILHGVAGAGLGAGLIKTLDKIIKKGK